MKGQRAELTTRIRRPPELEPPRVLVAAATTAGSRASAQALRAAGYLVSTTLEGDVLRDLRNSEAIELLVLDGSEHPWITGSIIDSVRVLDWALPIVLVSPPDRELRGDAERLGVEAILDSPVAADELRRVATKIVPLDPAVEFALAG